MSINETSELSASDSTQTQTVLNLDLSSRCEITKPSKDHNGPSAGPNLQGDELDNVYAPILVESFPTIAHPPLNRPPYTEGELQQFLDCKPKTLVIVANEVVLQPKSLSNVACIVLTSPTSWRVVDAPNLVNNVILSLANSIGQVAIIGKSSSICDGIPFEMRALAAAVRLQSRALVAFIPELESNGIAKIDLAMSQEFLRDELPQSREFISLGYRDKISYFWSFSRKCVLEYSPSDMINAGTLTLLCGDDWLRENYGYFTKTGQQKVDYRDVGVRIMEECSKKGLYKVSNTYGTGVWRDSEDPDCLIVNNGDDIWRTDGRIQYRVGERFVYTANRTLNLGQMHPQSTPGDARALLADLASWNWKRPCDPVLMLGFIMSASFPGAQEWRVHAAITGKQGTGKSSLITMIRGLLGDFLITCSGSSTEPSIRRQIKNDSLAIIVDEAEKESSNVKALMSYLRASSSGDKDMKANRNDGVDIYTVRSMGLISAVDLPQFLPADEGRYIRFSLVGNPISSEKPDMAKENDKLAPFIGLRMISRMIHSWPRYRHCIGIIRKILIYRERMTQRYADSLSTILSAAWVALHDGVISEDDAREFISGMDFSEEKEQLQEQADDSSFVDHALDTLVSVSLASRIEKMTLRMVVEQAANNDREAATSIQMYGLRVIKEEDGLRLLIDEKNSEFKKLFRDTKWNNIDFATTLKRFPGASSTRHKEIYIGGKTVRPFSLPLHVPPHNSPLERG